MKKSDQRKMVSFNREQPKSILVRKIGLYHILYMIYKLNDIGELESEVGKIEKFKRFLFF